MSGRICTGEIKRGWRSRRITMCPCCETSRRFERTCHCRRRRMLEGGFGRASCWTRRLLGEKDMERRKNLREVDGELMTERIISLSVLS